MNDDDAIHVRIGGRSIRPKEGARVSVGGGPARRLRLRHTVTGETRVWHDGDPAPDSEEVIEVLCPEITAQIERQLAEGLREWVVHL